VKPVIISRSLHVFKCLDADEGGTVDKPEIMAALKVLGVKASKKEIEDMISHVDKKNTGTRTQGDWGILS
jgi:Ca2+-binding EF-hand superfamily protein